MTDARPTIFLVHGPNLNMLGKRDPKMYGTATLDDYVEFCRARADSHGYDLEAFQSNYEGALVEAIQQARDTMAGLIINPGAFTHYAWSIHDALELFKGPKIEVHISNVNAREPWRHTSVVSPVVKGTIAGFGMQGYGFAIDAVAELLKEG